MKRDDIISGVIGGTIFVVGCTVGIFGYLKMSEPVYVQTPVEKSDQSVSYVTGQDNSDLLKIEQEDASFYDPVTEESNVNDIAEETDTSDNVVEEDIDTYQENNDLVNEPTDMLPSKLDPDAIERLSENTRFSVDVSDDPNNNGYNFDTYDNEEQQETAEQYVLNTKSLKIHYPECTDVKKISPENYATSSETIDELTAQGYTLCGHCFR